MQVGLLFLSLALGAIQTAYAQSALVNGNFETPAFPAGGYQYNPTGAGVGWTFDTGSGIQRYGSVWGATNSGDGNQTAFIQSIGTITQAISINAGSYSLGFLAARRAADSGRIQPIKVSIDGQQLGALISPASSTFAAYNLPFTIAASGTHTLKFEGTAATADSSFLDAVTITVCAPTVALTSPTAGQTVNAPGSFTLTATASTPAACGTITKVEFYNGATLLSAPTTAPYTYNWTGVAAGNYTITAIAYDSRAQTAQVSVNVSVTTIVNALVNGNFETPALAAGGYQYNPTGTGIGWTFDTGSGIQRYGSVWGATNSGDGNQTAFIQSIGTITQAISINAGSYSLGFLAARRAADSGRIQPIKVSIDGQQLGALISPASTAFAAYNRPFTIAASGTHTLKFEGTAATADSSFLDAVTITSSNSPPAVTLTSPANGATYNNGATVPLAATATDSDGTVSKVEFYQAGTLISTVTTGGAGNTGSNYSFSWTTAAPGPYALTAKAYDNVGAPTTSTTANITVCVPTVALTSPTDGQAVNAPGSFTLTATASTPAACGTITKVEFYNGATLLSAPTSAPYTYNWTGVPAGNYTIIAKAYDSRGQTAQATVNVVVNALPTATLATTISGTTYTAPATFVVNAPISLTLNATAADSDGSISKVEFYNGASLLGSAAVAPYNLAWSPSAAAYAVVARAYDNRNATGDSPALTVTVCGPPTVSITSPTAGQTTTPPGSFTLGVNTSTPSACGSITQVEYYTNNGSTLVATGTVAPTYSATWSNIPVGSYGLTAKAYTTRGLTGTSSSVAVTVNTLPTVTLTAPVNNAQLTLPGPFTLTATATDPDTGGSISQVEFLANGTVIGTKTASPYTFSWSPAAAGTYAIAARATDNLGGVKTSTAASVVVANAPTVTILTPTSGQIVPPATAVTVSANLSVDSARGRAISTVVFQAKNSAGNVIWSATTFGCAPVPCTNSATFTPNATGTYTLTATLTDTASATATSSSVTLIADVAPVVSVTSDRSSYATPASVRLTATATDSDGTVQSVSFYANGSSIGTGTAGGNNTYLLTWSSNVAGTYAITAKATDNLGASTTSTALTITIVQGGPTTVYYHNDFEGSPLAATDAQGHVVWLETYAPYGERYLNQNTAMRNGLWYNGKPTEDSSGLSYYGGRWYNPTMGRFYSVDPQRFKVDNPLSFNRYAYANNNPYRFIDPDGHSAFDIGFLIWDIGKLGVTLYNGSGAGEAAIDVGISVIGVISPIPGSGLAIKGARAARAVAESAKAIDAGRVAVIGENMDRVAQYAQRIGAESYQGAPKGLSFTETLEHNRQWIRAQVQQGATIHDIGPDFDRRLNRFLQGKRTDSPFYGVERAETKEYSTIHVFQRDGKFSGGVPGLDN